jgi:hypothetical protein
MSKQIYIISSNLKEESKLDTDNFLKKTAKSIKSTSKGIKTKYDKHIRKRAIKATNKKLKIINLTPDSLEADDYEAMVADACKDIQSSYNKRLAQVALSALGLDLLFGI